MSTENSFVRAAGLMDAALSQATGLRAEERKLVTYYALATHALPHLSTFPMLVLKGKMGTGKSQAAKIVESFAYRASSFSLRSMTLPAIRDVFASCHEGTAIMEEADQAWHDNDSQFERLLSDRYQRGSAKEEHKHRSGDAWKSVSQFYFGGTVLHRRTPFNDAALDGRSITIVFRPNHSRRYAEYNPEDAGIVEAIALLRDLVIGLPTVEEPEGVAARILNTYRPLLAVAKLCGDETFLAQIKDRLLLDTLELKEAQSAEPDGLVLRAILEAVYSGGSPTGSFGYIKLSALADSIFKNHKIQFHPRQIGSMARQLDFQTKNSHGVTVVVPTLSSLLKACQGCGYEDDEAVAKLKSQLLGESAHQPG